MRQNVGNVINSADQSAKDIFGATLSNTKFQNY